MGGVPEPETTLGSKALSLGKGFVISETANLNEQYVGISKLCGSVWGLGFRPTERNQV